MARERVTGVLLVGGASRRFGSPKALARLDGETLAERAWRTLGEACDERLAVGKAADALPLPFPVADDGAELRAAIVGVAAGLRLAPTDLCVVVPVDLPDLTPAVLEELARAADGVDVAVPQTGPAPRRVPPLRAAGPRAAHRARRAGASRCRWPSSTRGRSRWTRRCCAT